MSDENLEVTPEEELRVAPEEIEVLEERYPPEEDERRPPPRRRTRRPYAYEEDSPEPNIFSMIGKGEIGMGEAWLMSDMADRRERRERRYAREDETPTTAEAIKTAVSGALEKAGITGKPPSDEMPEWAKSMKDDMTGISKKLEDDERKREQEELIEKATQPLRTELEKEREERKRMEKDIEDLKKPSTPADAKTGMDQYLDYQTQLRNAGLLKDTEGKVVFGPDGIPVSGEIPAWAVYGPTLADEIFDNIEKRVDKIASGFGVDRRSKGLEDLIKLPDKPEPEKPRPPLRPVKPREEAPAEVEEAPLKPERPEEPAEELIKLPERVIPEESTAEEAVAPLKEEEAVDPLKQGLVTSEIEYEPESEPAPELEPEVEVPTVEEEVVAPLKDKKQYFCKFCGEGPFDETWQIAQHVKGCETAKEAKEATE